jgi:sulfur-oxidizing protein SoxY
MNSPLTLATGGPHNVVRRRLLIGAGLGAWLRVGPAKAAADDLAAAISDFAGGAAIRPGRVAIEIATLVDNGNTVPITIDVESPMTARDHVMAIALFNQRNPERDVIRCRLGPRSGRARIATRIRLATSQQLVAIAQMSDGSFWSHAVDVVVTLAACIEGEG